MFANHATMMKEGMRQGQAETEQRISTMKMMSAGGGNESVNPCNAFFSNDREICVLSSDRARMKNMVSGSCLRSPFTFMPCFWPHALLLQMPCSYINTRRMAGQTADAHKLILRESSLQLAVEPYPQQMQKSSFQVVPCSCCNCVSTDSINEVIPLTEITSVRVEKCELICCGMPVAPDSIVVRCEGMHFPVFSIDMPEDGEAFAARVMKQVEYAKSAGRPCPPTWPTYKASLGGMGGAAGMMGMMAGMMNQGQGQGSDGGQQNIKMQQQMMGKMMVGGMGGMGGAGGENPQFTNFGIGAPPAFSMAEARPVEAAVAGPGPGGEFDIGSELKKLADLKSQGFLNETEFKAAKTKLLGM